MDTMTQKVAGTIKKHRKAAGLTQLQLAQLAGIGKTAVFDVEHGKSTVQLNTVLKLLHVLNIKLELHSPLPEEHN